VNRGRSWSPVVRISDRGSGAPYKTRAGFRFPYGDYFAMAVDSRGISYLIWSEGDSYDGPGNTWWAHNHRPRPEPAAAAGKDNRPAMAAATPG
jgi:hypothetical protein